jgi:hypothetical protein
MKIGIITLITAALFALPVLAGPPVCGGPDADSDGIQFTCDNCTARFNPDQIDTDGDGCGNACDPDFNQDGVVGAGDFGRLVVNFGSTVPPASPNIDMAPQPLDHLIGSADWFVLAASYGKAPGPSGTTSECVTCRCPGTPPTDLIAHWRFDEGVGSDIAIDASGNGYDGAVSGATWVLREDGFALGFDGTDDYVDVGGVDVVGQALTISLWFKAESFGVPDARLISKSVGTASSDHDFMLSTISDGGAYRLRLRLKTGGTTDTLIGSASLSAGRWTHAALVYDGSALRLYQDGTVVGMLPATGNVGDTAPGTWIGRNPDGYGPFHGAIDDVQIYGMALDETQVLDVMVGELIARCGTCQEPK